MNTDYMGSIHDPINEHMKASYAQWVHEQALRADCGWVSVTEVELTKGLSTLIAYKANPIMERKELNKEAKAKRATFKAAPSDFLYPQGFFSAQPALSPAMLAAINGQPVPAISIADDVDEEEEHEAPINQW
jgi:hypothetical protein